MERWEQVALQAAEIWIISSEHQRSRLGASVICRHRDLLATLFDEIQLHINLRHPLHTAVSS